MIRLTLPWPISINAYWKSRILNRCGAPPIVSTYVTAAGVKFQKEVLAAVIQQLGQHSPLRGRLKVSMRFYQPTARKCDISNYVKTTEDALTKARVWIDDEQIDAEHIYRITIDRVNPRAEVEIYEIATEEKFKAIKKSRLDECEEFLNNLPD
jgi:crossover junction endodeoxyribonuclease RusA